MKRIEILETNLEFVKELSERNTTDMIVIHHTGCNDIDASAEQIHQWHLSAPNYWAGIGYHFVIRKDGTVERGRPEWAIGSHAYGENSHTIGIHLSGDFMQASPTDIQIENCAMLIANLCEDYDIPTDRNHIVGHGELMETSCPGTNLQALLDDGTITGKANWYRYGPPEQEQAAKETAWHEDLKKIQQELSGEERIWNFLKGKGLNDFATAGIMGNLYAESGLSSINLENYYESSLGMTDEEYTAAVDNGSYDNFIHDSAGYGLAQWTYWSRKQGLLELAKSKSVSIGNIDMQLEYLWSEMQSYHGMMVKLKDATSVEDATSVFMLEFERPADQSGEAQQGRVNFSQSFYGRYAGRAVRYKEKEETEMRYNKISEMPEWAKPTIEKMIGLGIIGGGGVKDENGDPADLDLSHDMIRVFVSNDRAGLYS